jgi:hypothetical protein
MEARKGSFEVSWLAGRACAVAFACRETRRVGVQVQPRGRREACMRLLTATFFSRGLVYGYMILAVLTGLGWKYVVEYGCSRR